MPKQPHPPIVPSPDFDQPELFFEISGSLVPSEAAAPTPEIFNTEVVAAVKAATSRGNKPIYDPLSETIKRRRAAIAKERVDYLSEHPEDVEEQHPAVEDVVDAVVPMVLQGTLFEINSDATPKPEGKKVAFGRYVKSAIYKVAGEVFSYALTTEDERKMMTPKGLSRILMPPSFEVKEDDLVVDGLLLNQVEYRLLPRSPKHVARNSSAKTYGQRDVAENPDVHDRAKRSIAHTFERMLPGMAEHRQGMSQRLDDISRLIVLAKLPGFAHETPQEMNRLLGSAWMEFDNIINTLAVKFEWDTEHIQAAKSALLGNITTGPQNVRTRNFSNTLLFAKNYLTRRMTLFDNRIKAANKYIPDNSEIA